jgi:hypothetical protein
MVLAQTQLEGASSSKCDDHYLSQRCPTNLSLGDEEPMANISAEYQEWPMHGVLKRTTIEGEARYNMEFSLEQVHKSHAFLCLHASQASSNIDFSIGSTSSSRLPIQAKTRSGPTS